MSGSSLRMRFAGVLASLAFLASCEGTGTGIEVEIPVAVVQVSPGVWTLAIGQRIQLSAVPQDTVGNPLQRSVTWTSSDPEVAEVDGSGLVTGLSDGRATILSTSEGVAGTATLRVIEPGAYDCSLQSDLPQVECWTLVALQEALGGPEEPDGWLAEGTPCNWQGVSCTEGSISELSLHDQQLTGSIPPELGSLANLDRLELWSNELTGSIPPELGSLANLDRLELYNNQFTGSIPPELGQLSNLRTLYLFRNSLTGSIPPELGNLTKLQGLHLSSNPITGSIPPELGNLASLQTLELSQSDLNGSIPPELGSLANLQHLNLMRNQLSGSIPAELGTLADLETLYLGNNQLAGSIPPELGSLGKLSGLGLPDNQLTGSIPPELGDLNALHYLVLDGNQLGGSLPLKLAQKAGMIQDLQGTNQCHLVPPGNEDLYMPDTQEYRAADMDGDGLICGLGFSAGLAWTARTPSRREAEGGSR